MSRVSLGLAAACCLVLALLVRAEPAGTTPERVAVLVNGGVVRGRITAAGDYYFITLPRGEIRLRAADVQLVCHSLDEAYELKRAAIQRGRVGDHLDLAEWCLRQGMFGYAARELIAARAADAAHPRIELLERRLNLALHPVEFSGGASPAPDRATQKQLDEIVRRLPSAAVETFTARIQPLLMNGCSTAACHGPAVDNRLRLERVASGRPVTMRITHRNLFAVLQCVDVENPGESSLLSKSSEPHGPLREPVLDRHDESQRRMLADWVRLVSQTSTPAPPDSLKRPKDAALLQWIDAVSPGGSASTAASGFGAPSAETGEVEARPVTDENGAGKRPTIRAAHESRGLQFGAAVEPHSERDPFDPDVFNRRYETVGQASHSSTADDDQHGDRPLKEE